MKGRLVVAVLAAAAACGCRATTTHRTVYPSAEIRGHTVSDATTAAGEPPVTLTRTQAEFHFTDHAGQSVVLRVLEASRPDGAWAGNPTTVRAWMVCRPGSAAYDRMTDTEVLAYEAALGEIDPAGWSFVRHPGLGRVLAKRPG